MWLLLWDSEVLTHRVPIQVLEIWQRRNSRTHMKTWKAVVSMQPRASFWIDHKVILKNTMPSKNTQKSEEKHGEEFTLRNKNHHHGTFIWNMDFFKFIFFNPSVTPASIHSTIKENNENLFVSQSEKWRAKSFTTSEASE